jgi:ribulose-phosphate 3-epimerase
MISPIVPAVIPQSKEVLERFVSYMQGVPEIHVDVVDGVFVPAVSWPYTPKGEPNSVHDICAAFTLEVDLMVERPLEAAKAWLLAGADMLVFHIETISVEALTVFCEATNVTVGVSALNSTPYDTLKPYLAVADYVQVMGIADIGAQGQPFDESALTRVATIRQDFPQLLISFDGSLNRETIPKVVAAGVQRCVVGSAIGTAPDPRVMYQELRTVFSSTTHV